MLFAVLLKSNSLLVLKLISGLWTGNFDLCLVSVKVLVGASFSIRLSGSNVFLYSVFFIQT